jgi:hypothetical protein
MTRPRSVTHATYALLIIPILATLIACSHTRTLPDLAPIPDHHASTKDHLQEHVFETGADGAAIKPYAELSVATAAPQTLPCDRNYGVRDYDSKNPYPKAEELNKAAFNCILKEAISYWCSHDPFPCSYKSFSSAPSAQLPPFRLTLYFNGGLNSTSDVERTARDSYLQAQATGTYLIYMIWPTGGWETWREGSFNIKNGRYEPSRSLRAIALAPFSVGAQVLSGIGQSPSAFADAARAWYATGFGFGSKAYNMEGDAALIPGNGKTVGANQNLWFEKAAVDQIYRDDDPDKTKAQRRVGITLSYGQLGALTPARVMLTPFAIGFGTTMWDNMVRRARSSIRAVQEFDDRTVLEIQQSDDAWTKELRWQRDFPQGTGAFAQFFQWLESCRQAATEGSEESISAVARCPLEKMTTGQIKAFQHLEITMLGHSMGGIVINGLLIAFPHLPYENIVYMGAAASIRETARAVGPLLSDPSQNVHFFNLMLHPMDEAREASSGGLLISGSLLFMVDDLFEQPKTIPDRTVGQWRNLRQARHLFSEKQQERVLFRVFSRTAPACQANTSVPMMEAIRCATPETHSDFNDKDVPFWCPEFWGADKVEFKDLVDKSKPRPWQWCAGGVARPEASP